MKKRSRSYSARAAGQMATLTILAGIGLSACSDSSPEGPSGVANLVAPPPFGRVVSVTYSLLDDPEFVAELTEFANGAGECIWSRQANVGEINCTWPQFQILANGIPRSSWIHGDTASVFVNGITSEEFDISYVSGDNEPRDLGNLRLSGLAGRYDADWFRWEHYVGDGKVLWQLSFEAQLFDLRTGASTTVDTSLVVDFGTRYDGAPLFDGSAWDFTTGPRRIAPSICAIFTVATLEIAPDRCQWVTKGAILPPSPWAPPNTGSFSVLGEEDWAVSGTGLAIPMAENGSQIFDNYFMVDTGGVAYSIEARGIQRAWFAADASRFLGLINTGLVRTDGITGKPLHVFKIEERSSANGALIDEHEFILGFEITEALVRADTLWGFGSRKLEGVSAEDAIDPAYPAPNGATDGVFELSVFAISLNDYSVGGVFSMNALEGDFGNVYYDEGQGAVYVNTEWQTLRFDTSSRRF